MGCVKSRTLDEVSSNSAENERLLPSSSCPEEDSAYMISTLPTSPVSPTPDSSSINNDVDFQDTSGQVPEEDKFQRSSSDAPNVMNVRNMMNSHLLPRGQQPYHTRHTYPPQQQSGGSSNSQKSEFGGSYDQETTQQANLRRNQKFDGDSNVEMDGVFRNNSNTMNGTVSRSTGMPAWSDANSAQGKELLVSMTNAYSWRDKFDHPSQDFLSLMDRLYMECQLHLTALSSRGDMDARREADAIVCKMISLRNHWGPRLLPNSICNAFVRERIPIVLGENQQHFRIDCAQFFEPVPFYGSQHQDNPGELMKLYRFSVYDVAKNQVVLRYYLERSNVTQLYHVLCFTCESCRGQVHPYGSECPSYWEIRQHMMADVYSRLLNNALPGRIQPPLRAHVPTVFPATQTGKPVMLEVPPLQN